MKKSINLQGDNNNLSGVRILIACEESGAVTNAFRERGFNAMSCDLMETSGSKNHYKGDIFDILHLGWDVIIGFPPCTYLTNSGARWLYNENGSRNQQRWSDMANGAAFFRALWDAPASIGKAFENPVMMGHAKKLIWGYDRKADQTFQPYNFGHSESKRTCLWLDRLPKLKHTTERSDFAEISQTLHYLPPSPDRAKLRSKTFSGVAEAMAEQWGNYIKSQIEGGVE